MTIVKFLFVLLPVFANVETYNEQVRLKVREHLSEVKECYARRLKAKPNLAGKIVVTFTIDDKSKVVSSLINKSSTTLQDKSVQTCVIDLLKTWNFPASETGTTTEVNYPFVLGKAE